MTREDAVAIARLIEVARRTGDDCRHPRPLRDLLAVLRRASWDVAITLRRRSDGRRETFTVVEGRASRTGTTRRLQEDTRMKMTIEKKTDPDRFLVRVMLSPADVASLIVRHDDPRKLRTVALDADAGVRLEVIAEHDEAQSWADSPTSPDARGAE